MIGIKINLLDYILGPWHTLQAWAIPVQITLACPVPVTIIWRWPDRENCFIEMPLVSLNDQLVCSADHVNVVGSVELTDHITAKQVPRPPGLTPHPVVSATEKRTRKTLFWVAMLKKNYLRNEGNHLDDKYVKDILMSLKTNRFLMLQILSYTPFKK